MAQSLTIGQLQNNDSNRMSKSSGCFVQHLGTYHDIEKEIINDKFKSNFLTNDLINVYYVVFKLKVTSDNGKVYVVYIKANPDFNLVEWYSNEVQIFCNCADFKYRSAYALNKKHSLFVNGRIKLELGAALVDAPKLIPANPTLCKHSIAALNWLTNNYSNLMRTV